MSINILKELKIILVKKFDKYDYNLKYTFNWIKFHKKKIVKRKNIAKTTKTKYAITKFWWWNLKIKFETILEWENLSGEKIWVEKNGKVFQNHLKSLTKSSLVLVQLVNLFCTVSVIPLYNNLNFIHHLMNIWQ